MAPQVGARRGQLPQGLCHRRHFGTLAVEPDVDRHLPAARAGGGEKRVAAQHAKGKLTARERLEVLLDDRDERPGVMFAEMELIGIPHRLTIGERGLKEGKVEYVDRRSLQTTPVPVGDAYTFVRERLARR